MESDKVMAAILEVGASMGFVLKEKQIEAIDSFVKGKDVFVSLPTGYGKSAHPVHKMPFCSLLHQSSFFCSSSTHS